MPLEGAGRQRFLGLIAALVGFLGLGYGLSRMPDALATPPVATAFSAVGPIRDRLAPPAPVQKRIERVVLLADSTMIHKQRSEEGAPQLRAALSRGRRAAAPLDVISIVFPGFDVYDYWALADRIIDAEPERVVLAINLRNFDVHFGQNRRRAELVGWIDPQRIPEALGLPLRSVGMSPDRVLLYTGLVQAGVDTLWADVRQSQARIGAAWKNFATSPFGDKDKETPTGRFRRAASRALLGDMDATNRRYDPKHIEWFYGSSLAGLRGDEAPLVVLDAFLRHLGDAGVPVLVYVAPVNIEYIGSLGFETGGFERSTQRIGEIVRAAGGDFADLHALLPDSKFNDPVHFSKDGRENGIRTVTHALARSIAAQKNSPAGAAN